MPSGATVTNGAGTNSIKVTYGNSFNGSGVISVTANNGCGSSLPASITVNAATLAPGVITGAASVCKTQTSVAYSISAVSGAVCYTWTISGGATFVGTSNLSTITTTGTTASVKFTSATSTSAVLTVVANNACTASSISQRTIAVALSNCRVDENDEETIIIEDEDFVVGTYPNPFNSIINVSINSSSDSPIQMMLFDVTGRLIMEKPILSSGTYQFGDELASGMYMINLVQGDKVYTSKINKIR